LLLFANKTDMANGAFLSDDGRNWLACIDPKKEVSGKPQDRPDKQTATKLLKKLARGDFKENFREFSVISYWHGAKYGELFT
jgi:hypothetical protein